MFSIFCASIDGIVLLWLCEKLLKYFQLSLSKSCFSKFYKYFNTEIIWFSNIFTSNFIEVLLDFQEKLDFLSNTAFFSKPFTNVKQTWLRQREIFWSNKKKILITKQNLNFWLKNSESTVLNNKFEAFFVADICCHSI